MTDLRKAAERALRVLEADEAYIMCAGGSGDHQREAALALRQALAQPKQKPVAWIKAKELELMRGFIGTSQRDWRTNLGLEKWDEEDVPLYTAPPKREWIGLTDEERSSLLTEHHGWNEYGKAIEAKLKEKNT